MTRKKIDLDQLTNRQMLEVERAAGMRFREITQSDILAMAAAAWFYVRENDMPPMTFDALLDLTPTQLQEMISEPDDESTSESDADSVPQLPSPTTP